MRWPREVVSPLVIHRILIMQRKQQGHRKRRKNLQNMTTLKIPRKRLHRNSSIQASSRFPLGSGKLPWTSSSLDLLRGSRRYMLTSHYWTWCMCQPTLAISRTSSTTSDHCLRRRSSGSQKSVAQLYSINPQRRKKIQGAQRSHVLLALNTSTTPCATLGLASA